MTDAEALLAAIVENPEEDTPRLCYADEIECSDPERAEFIRLSITLALHGVNRRDMGQWGSEAGRVAYLRSRNERKWLGGEKCRACRGEGFFGHEYESPIQPICEDCHGTGFACWPLLERVAESMTKTPVAFSRGFLNRVEMPCGEFMRHAGLIFKWHPTISEIRLTDKEPGRHTGGIGDRSGYWWEPGIQQPLSHQISFELGTSGQEAGVFGVGFHGGIMVYVPPKNTPRDKGWATVADAHAALSIACLHFGHAQATPKPRWPRFCRPDY